MIDLYRIGKDRWVVVNSEDKILFSKIEAACDFMLNYGIIDDEIDFALADMVSHEHNHAQFGVNGFFIYSDKETIDFTGGTS